MYVKSLDNGWDEFENPLKPLIDNSFKRFKNRDFRKLIAIGSSPDAILMEYRTLYCLQPRQVGTTNCLANVFDMDYDLYVGYRTEHLDIFSSKLKDQNKIGKYHRTTLKSKNVDFGNKNIKRVFIDVGGPEIVFKNLKQIQTRIKALDVELGCDVVYIIT